MKYVMAENRWAYAKWCDKIGEKQNHAVYVRSPEQLPKTLVGAQFVFLEGCAGHRNWGAVSDQLRILAKQARDDWAESRRK